jgi:MFS family permease
MGSHFIRQIRNIGHRVFYGWWVVAAGTIINAFGVGTYFYGFSTFFNPMIAEFGWSRALMSGVYSLSRLEGGIEGPIAGWLIDRYGARKILMIGMTIAGIGYILLSQVSSPLSLYVLFGLTSIGFNMGSVHGTGAAAAKWFIKKRGRAFAFLITGNGLGGAIFVPVIAWLIVQYGWRWAAVIVGIGLLCIPLPLGLVLRSTPEEMGLSPDGKANDHEDPNSEDEDSDQIHTETDEGEALPGEIDFTVKEALKTRAFWTFVGAMLMRAFIMSSIVVHQIPHLVDIGIPYQTASNVLGMMVLLSVPGRFIFSWLGDLFSKKMLLFLLCIVQAIGIYIFIHATTMTLLYFFVIVYGISYGAVIPLFFTLRADLFGRKHYATIGGLMMTMTMTGTVISPILAGYLYDVTRSYTLVFNVFIGLILISGLLFLMIPRPVK